MSQFEGHAFNEFFSSIEVCGQICPCADLAPGTRSICAEEFAEHLEKLIFEKQVGASAAASIPLALSFAINFDCTNFQPDINSFHYEALDSINGGIVYWDVVLVIRKNTLVLDIVQKPNNEFRSEFVN